MGVKKVGEPVYSLALDPELVRKAQLRLEKFGYDSLRELLDDLLRKWLKENR